MTRLHGLRVPGGIRMCGALLMAVSLMAGCASRPTCVERTTDPVSGNFGNRINSPEDDYAAVLDQRGSLVFTSNRGLEGSEFQGDLQKYGEDIFRAVKDTAMGGWGQPRMLAGMLRSATNEGTFSPALGHDGEGIIARTHDAALGGKGGADLYWIGASGSLRNLGSAINSPYWDAQPSVLGDTLLVFASDRPGSGGKSDLYVSSRRAGGSWETAIPLGSTINTQGSELSPHLATLGKSILLFFASDGMPGASGKQDIYFTRRTADRKWTPARSATVLGAQVNSSADDEFPFLCPGHDTLYLASTRPGGCGGFDLYAVPVRFPKASLEGIVRDSTTGEPLGRASQIVIIDAANRKSVETLVTSPPESHYATELPPGTYILTVTAQDCYPSTPVEIDVPPGEKTEKDLDIVPRSLTPVLARIDLRSAVIPFFVTGYYRVNVSANLIDLRSRLDGPLSGVPYISAAEARSDEYLGFAKAVEALFDKEIVEPLMKVALPKFRPTADEKLTITIRGYADPRDLPAGARYVEDPLDIRNPGMKPVTIATGAPMTNPTLSLLRAYYAREYVDSILREKSPYYRELIERNLVEFVLTGEGVDRSDLQFPARRRVWVEVKRTISDHPAMDSNK